MRLTIFRAAVALVAIITPAIVTAANPLQLHAHVNEHRALSPREEVDNDQGNATDVAIIRSEIPRLLIYYQTTHDRSGKPISMLPLITEKNIALTHLLVCSLHINKDGDITLNDHAPTHPRYGTLWQEAQVLRYAGVKIMGMIGGAAVGTFGNETLDSPDSNVFNRYYGQLWETIKRYGLQGLDIDVEQPMSQAGVERLILRLRKDFGQGFIITMAPVASALTIQGSRYGWNLSGFDYRKLMVAQSGAGKEVAFYNAQFYSGFGDAGSPNQFHQIISDNQDMGLGATKVVIGQLTSPKNGGGFVTAGTLANSVKSLRDAYGQIGGIAGWEYFNGQPGGEAEPWKWAQVMTSVLRPDQVPQLKVTMEMAVKLTNVWQESAAAGMGEAMAMVVRNPKRTLMVAVPGPLDPYDADDVNAFVVLQIPQTQPPSAFTQRPTSQLTKQILLQSQITVNTPSKSLSFIIAMAWATSFSRPTKSDANPPPYYLLQQFQNDPEEPYCKGCGRLIDPKRSFGMIGTPASSSNAASQKQPADKKSNKGSKRRGGKHQDEEDDEPPSEQKEATTVKFCTAKCRSEFHHKKRDVKEQEKKIDETFVRMLNGEKVEVEGMEQGSTDENQQADGSAKKRGKNGAKPKKGEGIVVTLEEVEAIVFPREIDPEKVYGRKKNRKSRVLTGLGTNDDDDDATADEEPQSTSTTAEAAERRPSQDSAIGGINIDTLQLVDNHKAANDEIAPLPKGKSHPYTTGGHELARLAVRSGNRIRPPQEVSEVNGSVGGEKGRAERKAETEEMKEEIRQKRLEGDKKAHQKEMVKSVARKGVVFGFEAGDGGKRKYCECVIPGGKVVEPHFAKGNWGIRWRE
ncbi:glycoside hydrolase [Sordaria brevicollis]|uniref:Glycoside hydrolase n=1 Tax=Sordaria brevicollis TaxID=83679 RepID=A0AAE0NVW7_SORBR|nr:glycoside hydrolase [Sordaria brevicollis]